MRRVLSYFHLIVCFLNSDIQMKILCLKYGEIHINSSSQIHNSKRWYENLIIYFFQSNKSLQIHLISLFKKKKTKTPQQGTLPLFSHALYIYVYICVWVLFSYQLLLVLGTMCNSPRTQPSPPLPPAVPLHPVIDTASV